MKEALLEQIKKLKDKKILVIVEGPKDKAALEKFGIKEVIVLSKKPLYAVVEKVVAKAKECAILTDLDKKGKQLYSRLAKDLKKFRVKVDDSFRNYLFKNTALRQIEGLPHYVEEQT
jgi:5S rRNA maturation endonuclease (ribonuclease M5)